MAVKAPGRETQRDRLLSEEEIWILWNALDDTPARLVLKLQLATAQRKGEVLGAKGPEIDLASGWWSIPSEKAKNRLAHRVPLSALALELLSDVPRHANSQEINHFIEKGSLKGLRKVHQSVMANRSDRDPPSLYGCQGLYGR